VDGSKEPHADAEWLVTTIWREDETEATEQWEVSDASSDEAVDQVITHVRFRPHHVEARPATDRHRQSVTLQPGEDRRHFPTSWRASAILRLTFATAERAGSNRPRRPPIPLVGRKFRDDY
jgi:hypothetical protein